MCIYIYIYIHTYIHTYIHIYIYIYIYILRHRHARPEARWALQTQQRPRRRLRRTSPSHPLRLRVRVYVCIYIYMCVCAVSSNLPNAPLKIKITLETSPPKSRILAQRFAVHALWGGYTILHYTILY